MSRPQSAPWSLFAAPTVGVALCLLIAFPFQAKAAEGGRKTKLPKEAEKGLATVLPLNDCANGNLSPGDFTYASGEHFDLFSVTFPGQGSFGVSVFSAAFDAYLIVYGPGQYPNGAATAVNDTPIGGAEVFNLEDAPMGDYTVVVTSNLPAETGAYTVCSFRGSEQIDPGECLARTLGPPDTTLIDTGTIPPALVGSFYHAFYFDWPGGDLTVTLESAAFDAFLVIYEPPGSPSGVRHDVDEFFPPSTETFTMLNAPAGTWSILASAFSDGETGNYSVCLSSVPVPPTSTSTPTSTPTSSGTSTPGPTSTSTPSPSLTATPPPGSTATPTNTGPPPTATGTATPTLTSTQGGPTPTATGTTCVGPPTPFFPFPIDGATDVSPGNVVLNWNLTKKDLESLQNGIPKPVYGADDRLDIYQVTNDNHLDAFDSSAVQIRRTSLVDNLDGTFTLPQTTLNGKFVAAGRPAICNDEPFRDQPAPGRCSSFLVAPDILVTAGHCVENVTQCDTFVWVFGFQMLDMTNANITIPETDIYSCVEILGQSFVEGTEVADWAVIRLDRPVEGRHPVPVRRFGKVDDTEDLLMVGYPVGLPCKVAGGANVCDNSPVPHFKTNTDSYGGNSGSAVYDANTMQVEGILVRGANDFVEVGGCTRSSLVPNTGCGESVTRATVFGNLIPQQLQYNIIFGPCPNSQFVGISGDEDWQLPTLQPNTTYCWKIVASNGCQLVEGPEWTFTTGNFVTPTTTPTATASATPAATSEQTPGATFNAEADEKIDAKDLLLLIKSESFKENALFDFARFWKASF